ncbi:DnaD domain protein, partial [Vibrio sp. FNV 38]|nr:DnaD domain protein [Vibrio sp. FNV 38]
EDADRRVRAKSYTEQIKRVFEFRKTPTPTQQGYIDAWHAAGYSPELVQTAYFRFRDSNGREEVNVRYIDKVLKSWADSGIRTPEQADAEKAAFDAAKTSGSAAPPKAAGKRTAGKRSAAWGAGADPGTQSFTDDDLEGLVNQF